MAIFDTKRPREKLRHRIPGQLKGGLQRGQEAEPWRKVRNYTTKTKVILKISKKSSNFSKLCSFATNKELGGSGE